MINKDPHRYDDIIDLPHHISKDRHHMSLSDRAAQFAPFSALTGYEESIEETARKTEDEINLSQDELDELDLRFSIILDKINERPLITIKHFIPDEYKDGGSYIYSTFKLKRYDPLKRILIAEDKKEYDLDYIIEVDSQVIDDYFKNNL